MLKNDSYYNTKIEEGTSFFDIASIRTEVNMNILNVATDY